MIIYRVLCKYQPSIAEVEKVRFNVISKLKESLDEEPDHKLDWWGDEWKSDSEGASLCLSMTVLSEPGVAKWSTEILVSVVTMIF